MDFAEGIVQLADAGTGADSLSFNLWLQNLDWSALALLVLKAALLGGI